jgi:hypothetical protein
VAAFLRRNYRRIRALNRVTPDLRRHHGNFVTIKPDHFFIAPPFKSNCGRKKKQTVMPDNKDITQVKVSLLRAGTNTVTLIKMCFVAAKGRAIVAS